MELIDFSVPFQSSNLVMLKKKSKTVDGSMFTFLLPLSKMVWAGILISIIVVFVAFGLSLKLNYQNNSPFLHSLWFTLSSLLGQGTEAEIMKSLSSKIIVSSWWLFVLLMISCYTANLAAFLTVTKYDKTITSVEDLISQTKLKYGTFRNSPSYKLLKNSKIPAYNTLAENIRSRNMFIDVVGAEAIDKVLNEDIVLIAEDQSVPGVNSDCFLEIVGEPLHVVYHGIGLQKSKIFCFVIHVLNIFHRFSNKVKS